MKHPRFGHHNAVTAAVAAVLCLSLLLAGCGGGTVTSAGAIGLAPSPADAPATTLVLYGAGTLAVPFNAVIAAFEKENPGITVQPQYGGSVKMAKQITQLDQPADVLGVADYNVIPQQLYPAKDANWYIGFVSNAITFVYTDQSKGAANITADNWYKVLAEPGVQIGRANPNTDPSGYKILQMLKLAGRYYNDPTLYNDVLKNAPQSDMRDTETDLIAALESGQIDYLAMYRSDAIQHGFHYLQLPARINLSDTSLAADYAKVSVTTTNGEVPGSPTIYGITIPTNAGQPQAAARFVQFLLGSQGQAIMRQDGFTVLNPAIASGMNNVPSSIQSLVSPWPGK